jgi:hypothetical protein
VRLFEPIPMGVGHQNSSSLCNQQRSKISDLRSSAAGVSVFAETRLVAFVVLRSRWLPPDVR